MIKVLLFYLELVVLPYPPKYTMTILTSSYKELFLLVSTYRRNSRWMTCVCINYHRTLTVYHDQSSIPESTLSEQLNYNILIISIPSHRRVSRLGIGVVQRPYQTYWRFHHTTPNWLAFPSRNHTKMEPKKVQLVVCWYQYSTI